MADRNNNDEMMEEQSGRSTDSNLPILFADGYPTSLEKMSIDQLQLFIPFLLRCAAEGSEKDICPPWWPSSVPYSMNSIEKPKDFHKNWLQTLRKIVRDCYESHKQPFLLNYSEELGKNDKANLRYVTDSDTTTKIYSRNPRKLLLTFRNENMLYDKKKRMKLWKKHEETPEEQEEGEESTFVCMLCYYCDAVFYSDEAYTKHEQECAEKDEAKIVIAISDEEEEAVEEAEAIGGQSEFMAYFYLKGAMTDEVPKRNNSLLERSLSPMKKKKHTHRRVRHVTNKKEKDLERLIPFSSPAGIVLTKKNIVGDQYIRDSQELIDKATKADANSEIPARSKLRLTKQAVTTDNAVFKEMRQPRYYVWPKRSFRSITREANFEFLNRPLAGKLKPCSVVARKLTDDYIQNYFETLTAKREKKKLELIEKEALEFVDLCSDSEGEVQEVRNCNSVDYSGKFDRLPNEFEQLPMLRLSLKIPRLPINFTQSTINSHASTSQFSTGSNQTSMIQQPEVSSYTRQIFHPVNFNPIMSSIIKRPREDDDSIVVHNENRSIQSWIQTVNGENFSLQTS